SRTHFLVANAQAAWRRVPSLERAEVVVTESTNYELVGPNTKLIVASALDGAKVSTATASRRISQLNNHRRAGKFSFLLVPQAVAAAAADIAAGPGRDRNRRR